ncbi:MAG: hypothetical protein K0Q49_2173 [Haloplasmataceae bacterium]|jgi:hypothetical protein|nr:hypothetical protein [Haloplasmataceae bacterium]
MEGENYYAKNLDNGEAMIDFIPDIKGLSLIDV